MLVSRYALQSYPTLQGSGNSNYFRTRTDRDNYFAGQTLAVGYLCAIGGDPESTDWTEVTWEVDQYNGVNWATIDLSQNFALIVTNEGIAALSDAAAGEYKLAISRIVVKSTNAVVGTNLATWDLTQFLINSNGYSDICLDTNNLSNSTFTIENNLTYRTNLLNGGIQFTLEFDINCLGQFSPTESSSINPTLTDFDIAMIGLCVKDQRADTNGDDVLFAIANLPTPVNKLASTPSRVGNNLKLYLNTTLSNFGNVAKINCIETAVGSVPEVIDEEDLSNSYDGENAPYNLYIVDNLAGTNVPAIAIRKGNPVSPDNPVTWNFITPNDDTLEISSTELIDNSLKNYMIAGWNGTKYVPADAEKPNEITLAGLYTNQSGKPYLIYAGKVKNPNTAYNYGFNYDTTNATGYAVGDAVCAVVSNPNDQIEKTTFIFQITRVSAYDPTTGQGGKPLDIVASPLNGNKNTYTTGLVPTTYYGETTGTGSGLKVMVTATANASTPWNFPTSWIDKPLYVDYNHASDPNWDTYKQILPPSERNNKDRRGKLTIEPHSGYSMFVGWCINENTIKLALDLRNEATYATYGTTRYATNEEVRKTDANAKAVTSVTPETLKKNYLQITVPDSDTAGWGKTFNKPIEVNTYTKFNHPIIGSGMNTPSSALPNSTSFYGTSYRAMWADLAEYYRSDKVYPAGTLITIGNGLAEITEAKIECNGVISTKPGYELGDKKDEHDLPVALIGKVPVLFDGQCAPQFGDRVYLSKLMPGRASNVPNGSCLGKVIDRRKNLDQTSNIMCSIRIAF